MKFVSILLSIFVVLFVSGCDSKESDEVATRDIYIEANATVGSDIFKHNEIRVSLSEKGGLKRDIELVNGEYLTATYNNETVKLDVEHGKLSGVWYNSLFPYDGKTGVLTVTFHRNDGTTIPMKVKMVEPIVLYSPVAFTEYQEYENVNMNWEVPASDAHAFNVQAELGSPSINVYVKEITSLSDNGSYDFKLSDLADSYRKEAKVKGLQVDITRPCWLKLKLSRYNISKLGGTFAGSSYIKVTSEEKINDLHMVLATD